VSSVVDFGSSTLVIFITNLPAWNQVPCAERRSHVMVAPAPCSRPDQASANAAAMMVGDALMWRTLLK
jgi:hypothetical protein